MKAHQLTSEVYYEGMYKLTGKARKRDVLKDVALIASILGGIGWILSLLIRKQM